MFNSESLALVRFFLEVTPQNESTLIHPRPGLNINGLVSHESQMLLWQMERNKSIT